MVFMTKHAQNCHNTKAIAVPKEKGKKWQKNESKNSKELISPTAIYPVEYPPHCGMDTQCAVVCQNPNPYLYPWYPFGNTTGIPIPILNPSCLPCILPTSFRPGQVSPPHLGLSCLHPSHLTMSPPPLCPAHLIGSLSDLSPCICLSPVHLAHLPMSPPLHILPTSLAPSHVSFHK